MFVCVFLCVCVCVDRYTYTHVHTHAHTHTLNPARTEQYNVHVEGVFKKYLAVLLCTRTKRTTYLKHSVCNPKRFLMTIISRKSSLNFENKKCYKESAYHPFYKLHNHDDSGRYL